MSARRQIKADGFLFAFFFLCLFSLFFSCAPRFPLRPPSKRAAFSRQLIWYDALTSNLKESGRLELYGPALELLAERAISERESLSVLKRAQAAQKLTAISDQELYHLSRHLLDSVPWNETLLSFAVYFAFLAEDFNWALKAAEGLDLDRHPALALWGLVESLKIQQEVLLDKGEKELSEIEALLNSPYAQTFTGGPSALMQTLALFAERLGEQDLRVAYKVNAAYLAFREGKLFEAEGIAKGILRYEAPPQLNELERLLALFIALEDWENALLLAESSFLAGDYLLLAELYARTGRLEEAKEIWALPIFKDNPYANYGRLRHSQEKNAGEELREILMKKEAQALSQADWTSLRILSARLNAEDAKEIRAASRELGGNRGGEGDPRLELEAIRTMDRGKETLAISAAYWALINRGAREDLVWHSAAWWMATYQNYTDLALLLERAEEMQLYFKDIEYHRALIAIVQGDYNKALDNLSELSGGAEPWKALANRALISEAFYKPKQALEELSLAASLHLSALRKNNKNREDYVEILRRIAEIQAALGDHDSARRNLEYARDLSGPDLGLENIRIEGDLFRLRYKKAP